MHQLFFDMPGVRRLKVNKLCRKEHCADGNKYLFHNSHSIMFITFADGYSYCLRYYHLRFYILFE